MPIIERTRRHFALAATFFAPWFAGACDGGQGDFDLLGTTSGSLTPAGAFARVVADLRVGTLEVREGDGTAVRVDAEVRVRRATGAIAGDGKSAKASATPLPFAEWIALAESGDTVTLRNARGDSDHQLVLRVTLPRGQRAVLLHTVVGSINVDIDTAKSLDLRAETGSVRGRLKAIDGPLVGRVATGDFALDIDGSCGGCDIDVAVGSLRLGLPADTKGVFELGVEVGGLAGLARFGLTEQRSITRATAKGTRGQGGPEFKLHVGTGQIMLR